MRFRIIIGWNSKKIGIIAQAQKDMDLDFIPNIGDMMTFEGKRQVLDINVEHITHYIEDGLHLIRTSHEINYEDLLDRNFFFDVFMDLEEKNWDTGFLYNEYKQNYREYKSDDL